MVNKDWSLEEAVIAHEAAIKSDPSRSDSDPTLPLYQWSVLHELDIYAGLYQEDELVIPRGLAAGIGARARGANLLGC